MAFLDAMAFRRAVPVARMAPHIPAGGVATTNRAAFF